MVQTIVPEVDPEGIYLFGSHARGEARQESNVDLLIVVSEPFGPEHSRFQEINRVYRALSSFRIPNDVLLYSGDEFAKWSQSLNHVVGRCSKEAVVCPMRCSRSNGRAGKAWKVVERG